MEERILAWHFLPADRKLRWGKWRNPIVRPGVTYVHRGPIDMCKRGLHASINALNALEYAPGPVICRVQCWCDVGHQPDKLVCRRRRVLWMADATRALREYACWCAEQALALIPEDKREPRSVAAIDVARRHARGEATDAELDAARDAAWAAAWDAAWAAAWAAVFEMESELEIMKEMARETEKLLAEVEKLCAT